MASAEPHNCVGAPDVCALGILLVAGSLVPWLLNGEHGPIMLGYAELVPVFGMILCVVGRLVIMQQWPRLT
jgi:hypothetical protein